MKSIIFAPQQRLSAIHVSRFQISNLLQAEKLKGYITLSVSITLFVLSLAAGARAGDEPVEFSTFTFENDNFTGDDDGYTNDLGYTYGKALFNEFDDNNTPAWLQWLTEDWYISTMKNKQRGIAHMFFQRMQTPQIWTGKI